MRQPIKDLNDLALFAQVVDAGSFSAAARSLGLQISSVSRRIRALEEELGARLLHRSTRSISLTEAGQDFHRHCMALLQEAQSARESIEKVRTSPQGLVRLSCPVGLLRSDVAAIVSRYLADNPQVRVAIDATNRRVEPVEEAIDIAVRVRSPPLEDSDLAIRSLGVSRFVLVASPWFFAHHARPSKPEDLAGLPTLAMARPAERHAWTFTLAGRSSAVEHQPRLATDDLETLLRAALDGLGIALLPLRAVAAHLQAGRLEQVLPAAGTMEGVIHAVFPSRRGQLPAVRGLVEALARGFADQQDG